MVIGSDAGIEIIAVYDQKYCGSTKVRLRRSKSADGNSITKNIPRGKDKYIGNLDGNLSWIFFGGKNFEMGPGKKGAGVARVRRNKCALHTLYTFGTLNT